MKPIGAMPESCPAEKETQAYICGWLSQSENARAEAHLATCGYCRNMVAVVSQAVSQEETPEESALLDQICQPTLAAASQLILSTSKPTSSASSATSSTSSSSTTVQSKPLRVSEMACHYESEMFGYLAGTLAESQCAKLEIHLADCQSCRTALVVIVRAVSHDEQSDETALIDQIYQQTLTKAQTLFSDTINTPNTSNTPNIPNIPNAPIPFPTKSAVKSSSVDTAANSTERAATEQQLTDQPPPMSTLKMVFAIAALIMLFLLPIGVWQMLPTNTGIGIDDGGDPIGQNSNPQTKLQIDASLALLRDLSKDSRPNELRVIGFDYAPYRDSRGGENGEKDQLTAARAKLTAINLKQPSAASHHALAQAYLCSNDFDNAVKEMTQAVAAEPTNGAMFVDLAVAHAAKGDNAVAIKDLDQALKLAPNSPEAMFNRAILLERNNQRTEARQQWQKYLEVDTASPWAAEARRHLTE